MKLKKTLVLSEEAIRWGEEMAREDHRGYLSNVVSHLLEQEHRRRALERDENRTSLVLEDK